MKLLNLFTTALFIVILSIEVSAMNSQTTEKYQLPNGMTVLLEENSSSPVVAVNVWVKTGSACEVEGEYGLAHVHEHMLFKGTKKRKVGEIARLIEAGGGDINAFTSFDETVYYVVSASRFLDTTLDILSDVVENSAFDPDELEKELEVVIEEIKRGNDSPTRVLSKKMFATLFDVHPYKRPIIGTIESVSSFTREGILNFYNKWYSPQNMILVIVGDFDSNKIKNTIDNTFGKLEKRGVPDCDLPKEPVQKNLKTFVIEKDINESYLSMGFHATSIKHEDTPAIDVISNILGSGESSRLYRNIKERKGLVNNIYSYAYTPKYDGLFVISANLNSNNTNKAFEEIINELEKLKYKPVTQEELSKAVLNIESDSIYTKETMQGQAQKLGYFELEAGSYKYENEYLRKVRSISPKDIMAVAKKYFTKENLTAGILVPSKEKKFDDKELELIIEKIYSKLNNKKYNIVKHNKDVQKLVLDNGIILLIKENHSIPLFVVQTAFLGGLRYEDKKSNGISNFMSEMFTRGTEKRTSEEIANEIESLASSINGFSGKNSVGVTVEGLSKNFDKTLDILSDVILNPSFLDEEIERAKREVISNIKRQKDNLLRKTVNLFLSELFLEHPYKYNTLGTEKNVQSFNKNDLRQFYSKVIQPENMVISVVGNVESDKVVAKVSKLFGEMKKGDYKKLKLSGEPRADSIREKVVIEKDKDQMHIILGFQSPDIYDEDRYAFEVMNSILAGQGGRLFIELRDKKSLAYVVTSFNNPGLESGYFGVYIGTAPQKEQEAISSIKEQLELLLEKGVSDDELNRAKNYIVGNFEISLQKNSSQAAKIVFDELYDIGWDQYKHFSDKIFEVTKSDVLRVASKYIDLDKYTIAIVKPE